MRPSGALGSREWASWLIMLVMSTVRPADLEEQRGREAVSGGMPYLTGGEK